MTGAPIKGDRILPSIRRTVSGGLKAEHRGESTSEEYLHLYRGKLLGKNCHYAPLTLCSSEVPQDRWCGRTAGSGMWTRTENLLSWSPCGDSAIPYG